MAAIPSVEEDLPDLGTFVFVASHILSSGGQHLSAVTDILCLMDRMEKLHTDVQGVISSPHLATTLLYDVSRRWSL